MQFFQNTAIVMLLGEKTKEIMSNATSDNKNSTSELHLIRIVKSTHCSMDLDGTLGGDRIFSRKLAIM